MPTTQDDNLFGLEPDQVSGLLEQEAQQQTAQQYHGNPMGELAANQGRAVGNLLFGQVMGRQRPEVQMALRMQQMKMGVEQDAAKMGIDALNDPVTFNQLVAKHAMMNNLPQIAYKASINAKGLQMQQQALDIKQQEADAMGAWRAAYGQYLGQHGDYFANKNETDLKKTVQQGANAASVADIRGNAQVEAAKNRGLFAAQVRGSNGKFTPIQAGPPQIKAMGPVLDAAGLQFKDVNNKIAAAKYVAERSMYYQKEQGIKDPKQSTSMALNDLKNEPGYNMDEGTFGFGGGATFNAANVSGSTATPATLPGGWTVKVK